MRYENVLYCLDELTKPAPIQPAQFLEHSSNNGGLLCNHAVRGNRVGLLRKAQGSPAAVPSPVSGGRGV